MELCRRREWLLRCLFHANAPLVSEPFLEDVYLQRHLALRGITLQQDELQMSLEGAGIGFGVAPIEPFVTRVRCLETLIYRAAERRMKQPFRDAGRRRKNLEEAISLYMTVPRAASFAVTFRLGNSEQLSFLPNDLAREVIHDVLDCMEIAIQGNDEALQAKIPEESYFRNFVALAKRISPDGNEVRTVGFTALGPVGERRVALSGNGLKHLEASRPESDLGEESNIEVTGVLLSADATGKDVGQVVIVDAYRKRHSVQVPRGMMSDIVRPMFEEEVRVLARLIDGKTVLQEIEPAG